MRKDGSGAGAAWAVMRTARRLAGAPQRAGLAATRDMEKAIVDSRTLTDEKVRGCADLRRRCAAQDQAAIKMYVRHAAASPRAAPVQTLPSRWDLSKRLVSPSHQPRDASSHIRMLIAIQPTWMGRLMRLPQGRAGFSQALADPPQLLDPQCIRNAAFDRHDPLLLDINIDATCPQGQNRKVHRSGCTMTPRSDRAINPSWAWCTGRPARPCS